MARILLILSVLFLAGCPAPTPPAVFVGQVVPLSGPEQWIGQSAQRGVDLALVRSKEDEERKLENPVRVLHANAQGKQTTQAEAVRLKKVNTVVALLGGQDSREVLGLDQTGLPVISPAGLRAPGMSKNVFLTGLSPQVKGQALAEFAAKRPLASLAAPALSTVIAGPLSLLGTGPLLAASKLAAQNQEPPRIIVLVDSSQQEFVVAAEAFAKAYQKKSADLFGGTKVKLPVSRNYTDREQLAELLEQLPKEKPAAVFLAGTVEAVGKVRDAFSEPALTILFAGPEGSQTDLLASAKSNDGIFLATAWVADLDTQQNKLFVDNYQKTFGEPPNVHATLAYENAGILFEAMRQSQHPFPREELRDRLAELKDVPLLAGPGSIADDGRLHRPAFILQLRQGTAVTVGRHEPK